jgi:hypothetical protein
MSYCILLLTTILIDTSSHLFKSKQLTDNNDRIPQYLNGIKKIKELNPTTNIYISDNSEYLNNDSELLQYLIENDIYIIKDAPNKYGKTNKGAGLIENWIHNINLLKKYEYIIHFEPRQLLINNNFIENFLKNKRNLFTLNNNIPHFNTGLFAINSAILINYIIESNLDDFCEKSISIEDNLIEYFKNNCIEYNILEKMNAIRYDFNNTIQNY